MQFNRFLVLALGVGLTGCTIGTAKTDRYEELTTAPGMLSELNLIKSTNDNCANIIAQKPLLDERPSNGIVSILPFRASFKFGEPDVVLQCNKTYGQGYSVTYRAGSRSSVDDRFSIDTVYADGSSLRHFYLIHIRNR